ncbi:MAG: hypothetical protein PHQ35_01090 [Phycisphaerae bacterium]|nr:hypothetical protein [Phycisphaerae bacterium]MDD5381339.1 hypothetical protein [Phycisphaerae bacterium]
MKKQKFYFVPLCLCGSSSINQKQQIMQNEPNLGQSQISYNTSENNRLYRKIQIGHLVKTNPNEPNFKQGKRGQQSRIFASLREEFLGADCLS